MVAQLLPRGINHFTRLYRRTHGSSRTGVAQSHVLYHHVMQFVFHQCLMHVRRIGVVPKQQQRRRRRRRF